jgi:serine/threonine-protein kinase
MRDTPDQIRRIRGLFDAVMDQPPDEREAFLAREPDTELRREVEALLTTAEETAEGLLSPIHDGVEATASPPLVGQRLGAYDVIRLVGEGGMGAVYEAARADDQYRKRVAIKIVRPGLASELTLARFRRERQILATLEHPNIATLLDGGVTPDGRPFLVMEYVEGEPITTWCDARSSSIRERLALFRQVCAAVRHAHRNLVVHRDLKPGNIFVTSAGEVKLLDFGIAKLLSEDPTDEAMPLTRGGARAFTPEYASPEQFQGAPLTTASDIYSLGVVLFELVAGQRPYGEIASFLELERAVLTTPVPRPSTLATDVASRTRHERSGTHLRRHLHGELDQILLLALRPEPDRRYASVEALDDDLRRFLEGRPVTAQRDSAAYRLRKFVRRNRVAVAGIALGTASLIGGTGVALWQARTARREATKATRISDFLQGILGARFASIGARTRLPQANLSLQEVLDSAARQLPIELASEPLVRAQLHRIIAGGYYAGMNVRLTREHFDSALAIHRRTLGENDIEVARDLSSLSGVMTDTRPDSAEPIARQSLALFARHHETDSMPDYIYALQALASAQSYGGKLTSADSTFRRILTAERKRATPRLAVLGLTLSALGYNLFNQGKFDSAEVTMRHGIALFDSAAVGPSFEQAGWLMTFGSLLGSRGKSREELEVLRRARDMAALTVPPEHPLHLQVGVMIAEALSSLGDTAAAHNEARKAIAKIPAMPKGSELAAFMAEWRYARMLRHEGASAEAERAARQQFATGMASAGPYPYYVADAHYLLGVVLSDRGKYPEAERRLLDAYHTAAEKLGTDNSRTTRAVRELALLYLRWNHAAQASTYLALLSPAEADSLRRVHTRAH